MRLCSYMVFLFACMSVAGQPANNREEVYLHLNRRTHLTGETLLFSAYLYSALNAKPSKLSKYLYLEIINEDRQPVFQKKLAVEDGRAHGGIFFPSTFSTGTYQIIAYTRWMKNFGAYFRSPILIINPYETHENPSDNLMDTTIVNYYLSDKLIDGIEQEVNFRVINAIGEGKSISGRLVGSQNGELQMVKTNKHGYGQIRFTPSHNETYQLILEDYDNLVFSELPTITNEGIALSIEDESNLLEINDNPPEISLQDLGAYGTRDQIKEKLNLPNGRYSISIIKTDESIHKKTLNAITYRYVGSRVIDFIDPEVEWYRTLGSLHPIIEEENESTSFMLPEYRGEIVRGRLLDSLGQPVPDGIITVSVPGDEYQIRSTKSADDGSFRILFDAPIRGGFIYCKPEVSGTAIELDQPFLREYPRYHNYPVYFDSIDVAHIVERSIRNQIVNAYLDIKQVNGGSSWLSPFVQFKKVYVLDDYNRFPTVQDHFIEYISEAGVRRREGRQEIVVWPTDHPRFRDSKECLILLDGLIVSSEVLLAYNPYDIESISIIDRRFYIGSKVVDGVIVCKTFAGDIAKLELEPNTLEFSWPEPLEEVQLYAPDAKEPSNVRLPDYRDQLLWDPLVHIDSGIYELDFYASDTKGEFTGFIEGFTDGGEPYSSRFTLIVK